MIWPFRRPPSLEKQLDKMRADWDRRARQNARHFITTEREQWSDEEFFASGVRTVDEEILSDMENVCQGKAPKEMRVLEIGCGAGRITRALASLFGEIHAVDVSGEMVERARSALTGFPNAHVYQNNGMDLSVIPDLPFDFAFSFIVFQHIPNYRIVESYVREVQRLLSPGGLFKFQVLGGPPSRARFFNEPNPNDTWLGVQFSEQMALEMAQVTGFEYRHRIGAETQYFWLWFFKPES